MSRREKMVNEQIAARGIRDQTVLRAMQTVPRHLFVPTGETRSAYEDHPLSIGHGQTISQPYIVAFMTEIILPARPAEGPFRVLEIGAGSGYQAAVLSEIGADVYSMELIPALADRAQANLEAAGYHGVRLRIGDGWNGWPEEAPFDAIVVTAAAEEIPPPLIEQLRAGGRMILPVGPPSLTQDLVLVEKTMDGRIVFREVMAVRFVPLRRAIG